MKSMIKNIGQTLLVIPALLFGLSMVSAPLASAQVNCDSTNLSIEQGANCAKGTGQSESLFGDGGIFQKVTNILLFLVGAISVIMLIIGGIRYVVSGGDQAQVTAAKNTILYAIVGIVIAFLAFAAVAFVTGSLKGSA